MADFWGVIALPLMIFFARIADVSIGTIRIIFVSKGEKYLAPLLGFFEVLIWILVMAKIMQNLDRWYYYLFYAAGFATGNYIGILLEEKLAVGYAALRVITKKPADELIATLRSGNYGTTVVDADGSSGQVNIIYTILKRSELPELIELINQYNPKAFYTVEDVKAVNEGIQRIASYEKNTLFRRGRKGK